jgi:hypothetical protein
MNSTRRRFLGHAGTLIALPFLESLGHALPTAASPHKARNLVCIGAYLGLHTPALYPKTSGSDYEMTPSLEPLSDLRADFTLLSGLDHRAGGGHGNWPNFLCGKKIGDITLDQRVAAHVGDSTRFPSLVLSAGPGSPNMSFIKGSIPLPPIDRPSTLYRKLFASESDRRRTEYLLRSGRSALDFVLEDATSLRNALNATDRAKLEEYFTSVREVEVRMGKQITRAQEAVPAPDYRLPSTDPVAPNLMIECESIMLDLMALGLQSGATRVLSLALPGGGQVFSLDGKPLKNGYHALSHHGNDPEKIAELIQIDRENLRCYAAFVRKLKSMRDTDGKTLLDNTIVLFGTGMGDASRHSSDDLPTLVAGGGFQHGRHLAFSRTAPESEQRLLGDLFVSIERRLGIESASFSNATQSLDDILL